MPLLDYISGDEDERLDQVSEFLSGRWRDVLGADPNFAPLTGIKTPVWWGDSFDVKEVKVGFGIEALFNFKAKVMDGKSTNSGEEILGSALALIDPYDTVEFTEVCTLSQRTIE